MGLRRRAEAHPVGIAIRRHGVDLVGTRNYLNADFRALSRGLGDRNGNRSNLAARCILHLCDADSELTRIVSVFISSGNSAGELDRRLVATAQLHGSCHLHNVGNIIGREMQLPVLADNRLAVGGKANASELCLLAVYRDGIGTIDSEMTGFSSDIAKSILEIERKRVLAIGNLDALQRRTQIVLVASSIVGAIKIEVCRLNASCEFVRILIVVVSGIERRGIRLELGPIRQIRLRTVIIDNLERLHRRCRHVLIIGTIDKGDVVNQDVALKLIFGELGAIGRIPADAALGDHSAEQHATVDANLLASILCHVSFEIIPSRFSIFTVRVLISKVDKSIRISRAIFGRCNLRTQPRNRSTLRYVDPSAECRRSTRNVDGASQAKASAICTCNPGPIEVELHCLMPEANDVCKVRIGIRHDRAGNFTATARIAIGSHCTGTHSIKAVYRCANRAVIMAVIVATVENDGRLLAYIHGRGSREAAILGGDFGARRHCNITRGHKGVTLKRARLRVIDGPSDISIFEDDRLLLIEGGKTQVALLLIVKVDFVRSEREGIWILDTDARLPDNLALIHKLYGRRSTGSVRDERCRGGVSRNIPGL